MFTVNYVAGPNGTISGTATQTIAKNGTGTLVTADPDANYRFVRWSDGLTTAARIESGVTAHATRTAQFALNNDTVPVTSVTLNKDTTTIVIGSKETLIAAVEPDNATNKSVIWTSSKNSIASVSSNGTVTAKKAGTTMITVRTTDGNYVDTCVVTVTRR